MRESMLCSILIPVYNTSEYIAYCLDSIYSQQINNDLFEVICIDDKSSDLRCAEIIREYKYNGKHPDNLQLIIHSENKKRGGALNSGMNVAIGKWILCIDSDDYFIENNLNLLCEILKVKENEDIVLYNHSSTNSEKCLQKIPTFEMTGCQLIETNLMPWTSWCYAFKRKFLQEHHVQYVSDVYFEDADYVFKALLHCKHLIFIDLNVLHYNIYEGQTSKVNNLKKLEDLFKLSDRLKEISTDALNNSINSGRIILYHHFYLYKTILKEYLWRYPYIEMKKLLFKYKISEKISKSSFSYIVSKFPLLYIIPISIVRPLLLLLVKMKNGFK